MVERDLMKKAAKYLMMTIIIIMLIINVIYFSTEVLSEDLYESLSGLSLIIVFFCLGLDVKKKVNLFKVYKILCLDKEFIGTFILGFILISFFITLFSSDLKIIPDTFYLFIIFFVTLPTTMWWLGYLNSIKNGKNNNSS